jgi:hypothetical protein
MSPEVYNKPSDKSIVRARHPGLMEHQRGIRDIHKRINET